VVVVLGLWMFGILLMETLYLVLVKGLPVVVSFLWCSIVFDYQKKSTPFGVPSLNN
jgi:hypothetical protein